MQCMGHVPVPACAVVLGQGQGQWDGGGLGQVEGQRDSGNCHDTQHMQHVPVPTCAGVLGFKLKDRGMVANVMTRNTCKMRVCLLAQVYLDKFKDSAVAVNLKACNTFRMFNGRAGVCVCVCWGQHACLRLTGSGKQGRMHIRGLHVAQQCAQEVSMLA
eukprot:scaffold12220_cov21-Tisochrysis_lutea.AAC.3